MSTVQDGSGLPCPFKKNLCSNSLLYFGQLGDRAFGMLCGHSDVRGQAMGNGFFEMRDPFIQMRILHTGRLGMLECFLSMLRQGIGMPLFAMCHGFLGMFQGFSQMVSKSEPTEKLKTNERSDRCHSQYSEMDFHFHGFFLSG
jgi:hypothetical protein